MAVTSRVVIPTLPDRSTAVIVIRFVPDPSGMLEHLQPVPLARMSQLPLEPRSVVQRMDERRSFSRTIPASVITPDGSTPPTVPAGVEVSVTVMNGAS